MAGGYTHLTLVRSAIRQATNKLYGNTPTSKEEEIKIANVLELWGRYSYLGGVSPDYPYLGFDADWADLMHKGHTNSIISIALQSIHTERTQNPSQHTWQRKFAWLLGFTTHVIADIVIHPVVNLKVGRYEENKEKHRHCEMNQDVWIYEHIVGLQLHFSDNMKGEIKGCGRPFDLDDDIEELWADCLEKTYSVRPGEDQIDKWHAGFLKLVDFAEAGRKIPVFGRHLVSGAAAYPDKSELNSTYFEALRIPTKSSVDGKEMPVESNDTRPFNEIFLKALGHIDEAWGVLARDMFGDSTKLGQEHTHVLADWSLDTGINNQTNELHLWPWDKKLV